MFPPGLFERVTRFRVWADNECDATYSSYGLVTTRLEASTALRSDVGVYLLQKHSNYVVSHEYGRERVMSNGKQLVLLLLLFKRAGLLH
jgi:hypothetical protein